MSKNMKQSNLKNSLKNNKNNARNNSNNNVRNSNDIGFESNCDDNSSNINNCKDCK